MARAWFFATAMAKQREKTLLYLKEKRLDKWTHNKTIQKCIESYRITKEDKQLLREILSENLWTHSVTGCPVINIGKKFFS